MVRTSPSNTAGAGSIPGLGAKIPHASGPKNQNRSNIVTNAIKTLKNGPLQKTKIFKIKKLRHITIFFMPEKDKAFFHFFREGESEPPIRSSNNKQPKIVRNRKCCLRLKSVLYITGSQAEPGCCRFLLPCLRSTQSYTICPWDWAGSPRTLGTQLGCRGRGTHPEPRLPATAWLQTTPAIHPAAKRLAVLTGDPVRARKNVLTQGT